MQTCHRKKFFGLAQIGAILMGAVAGLAFCRGAALPRGGDLGFRIPHRVAFACLAAYVLLLLGGPLVAHATGSQALAVFDGFYRSGALVFSASRYSRAGSIGWPPIMACRRSVGT